MECFHVTLMDDGEQDRFNNTLSELENEVIASEDEVINSIDTLNTCCETILKCLDVMHDSIPEDVSSFESAIQEFNDNISELDKQFEWIDSYEAEIKAADDIVTLLEQRDDKSFMNIFKNKAKIEKSIEDKIEQMGTYITEHESKIDESKDEITVNETDKPVYNEELVNTITENAMEQSEIHIDDLQQNNVEESIITKEIPKEEPANTVNQTVGISTLKKSQVPEQKINKSSIKGIVFDDDD